MDEFLFVGGLLLAPDQIPQAALVVAPDDLSSASHRAVYRAILRCQTDLLAHGSDWTLVRDDLKKNAELGHLPDDYFETVLRDTVNPATALAHGRIVKALSRSRELLAVAAEIRAEIGDRSLVPFSTLCGLHQKLIRSMLDAADLHKLKPIEEALASLDIGRAGIGRDPDYPRTGLAKIDEDADMFPPGELVVVAGRPGTGKTSIMRQWAVQAARSCRVLFFTFEEPVGVIVEKMVCSEAQVCYAEVRRRGSDIGAEKVQCYLGAQGRLARLQMDFIDATLDATGIAAHVAQITAMGKRPRVVFIDHLQHMRHERQKGENDATMYGRAVRTLKEVAKQHQCSIVLACQLNREVERRSPPRPCLADLRDTGTIEEMASIVAFLWSPDRDTDERNLWIAKQRHGPPFEASILFRRAYGNFVETAPNDRRESD